jgi:RNA polymerase sigma-70 factor (TIGR02960 family)
MTTPELEERELLAAAQAGEEEAFVRLTSPHREALHRHAYRMLGSLHDADDAVQETMLRAWRSLDRFEPRAPVRAWLYRIVTNVSLRMLEQHGRRDDLVYVEPYPEPIGSYDEPAATAEEREAIGLAFVTAVQLLPPKQRAVLLLRDVLDWSAHEVAALLEDSTAAVNSALQRARDRLARERQAGTLAREHVTTPALEANVVRQFQAAWDGVDIERLLALLADDALMTMPPERVRIEGAEAIAGFFATQPMGGRLDRIKLLHARANGQPALAAYADEREPGRFDAYGLMVLALDSERVVSITGFPQRPDLFERLGLPVALTND